MLEGLGPTDCTIVGTEFVFPAHRAVLRARCVLLQALFSSGMSDSNGSTVHMPAHFEAPAVRVCRPIYDQVVLRVANVHVDAVLL